MIKRHYCAYYSGKYVFFTSRYPMYSQKNKEKARECLTKEYPSCYYDENFYYDDLRIKPDTDDIFYRIKKLIFGILAFIGVVGFFVIKIALIIIVIIFVLRIFGVKI